MRTVKVAGVDMVYARRNRLSQNSDRIIHIAWRSPNLRTCKLHRAIAHAVSVSSDVDGAKIVQQTGVRSNKAIIEMLASSREPLPADPELVASILQGAMAGIIRRLLESAAPEKQFQVLQDELILFASAYLGPKG